MAIQEDDRPPNRYATAHPAGSLEVRVAKQPVAKSCFVICPIGKEGSATRARSDKLLKHVIRPIFEGRHYIVERADQVTEPGVITNQIVKRIVECNILVADLSEGNPNVFYELAIRHGLKKPFIHMIAATEAIPFDNAQVRTIPIDLTDLDSVEQAKSDLNSQIDAIENGAVPDSPISVAFDLEALKSSGKPDEALLANLFQEVSSLRQEIRDSGSRQKLWNTDAPLKDLRRAVKMRGSAELLQKFDGCIIHSVRGDTITLSTNLREEEEVPFVTQLSKALSGYYGRDVSIIAIPF